MKGRVLYRLWLIYLGIFLFAGLLLLKLFIVQIVHGESYSNSADRQYVSVHQRIFDRGSIFFTEKDGETVSAATVKSGAIIAINPKKISNPSAAFNALSRIIPLESDSFFVKASKKNDPYEEIARRVNDKNVKKIRDLNIDGIIISKDRWRFYPAGNTASQTLGFVGYEGNRLSGRYGLERYYNDVLARGDEKLYVNFFAEIFSNISESFKGNNRAGDIITSIEPSVQGVLEDKINSITEKWKSEYSGGIIIDPRDGSIYALANTPDFDPNYFNKVKDPSVFTNPIVESVFEMGSIIKAITMAAGLDAGVVTAKTKYDDKGFVVFDGRRIENYDGKGRGVVDMQAVLNNSLNTGAAFVMQNLGKERFRDYMFLLGLGEETGIDLPNEVSGLMDNLYSKRDVEYVTASFGQGIAMTPIATVRALSALANGGTLITPHIVKKIKYDIGTSRVIEYGSGDRVFKPETSEEITRMLVNVVDEALAGGKVKLANYSVAAKTGTAQIAKENGRGYYKDKYFHSFFGYFPAYNPRFLVFLYTVNPRGVRYASHTLTEPFMDLVKFLLHYYEVPPDR
jgi:cell division protein FtsI/penicillin-binding protein 2